MTRITTALLIATATVSLAACSKSDGNSTVAIDMNSQADAGNVSINVPGFDAKVKVPTSIMANGDFDIDGVKLYPKSTVTNFNLNVDGRDNNGEKSRNVVLKMAFAAPADVPTVASWYKAQFAEKSVAATQTPTGFTGKTGDGDDFTIALTPGAAGQTNGAITVIDAKK